MILFDGDLVNQALHLTIGIDHTKAQDIMGLPLLQDMQECNCFIFLPGRTVVLPAPKIDIDEPACEQPTTCNNDNTDEHMCTFKIKGASYDCYQSAMAICRQNLLHVPIRVQFEPGNLKDKNAIKFQASLDAEWVDLGYVQVSMIPKVTMAMQNKDITDIKLSSVQRKFIKPVGALRYVGECTITKKGPWLQDITHFHYNDSMSYD